MSSVVTDYGQQYWSSVLFGLQPPPTQYFVALANEEPGKSVDGTTFGLNTEVQAPDYARVLVGAGPGNWVLSAAGFVVNLNQIFIASTTTDWAVIKYFVLCDALTGGNLYAYGRASNPQRVSSGSSITIPPGALAMLPTSVLPPIAP